MTDQEFIERELRREIRERKTVGYSARNRVCGSKTKRAAVLPSDYLTPKQWKERNGIMVTYHLSEPMDWKSFRAMPNDLQRQYLQGLVDRFNLTQAALAEMFHLSPHYLSKTLFNSGFSQMFARGRKMSDAQLESFRAFCAGELQESPKTEPQNEDQTVVLRHQEAPVAASFDAPATPAMQMTSVSATFEGAIDLTTIMNTLRFMVSDGSRGRVYIDVTLEGNSHG